MKHRVNSVAALIERCEGHFSRGANPGGVVDPSEEGQQDPAIKDQRRELTGRIFTAPVWPDETSITVRQKSWDFP
jgi:hypothetical protein